VGFYSVFYRNEVEMQMWRGEERRGAEQKSRGGR
jgi:hypothetical protein